MSAELRQRLFVDAGHGHGGIGDNVAAGLDGFHHLLHSMFREGHVVIIIKIRRGVDYALDHKLKFRIDLAHPQFLGDDFKAPLFNFHRLHAASSFPDIC